MPNRLDLHHPEVVWIAPTGDTLRALTVVAKIAKEALELEMAPFDFGLPVDPSDHNLIVRVYGIVGHIDMTKPDETIRRCLITFLNTFANPDDPPDPRRPRVPGTNPGDPPGPSP